MGSTAPTQLPALATNPKFIFFTDFDGTIVRPSTIPLFEANNTMN